MNIGLLIAMLVFGCILIILLFLQSSKVRNIGASIVGVQNVELFENARKRGSERVLHWITILCVFLFMLFAFLLLFL